MARKDSKSAARTVPTAAVTAAPTARKVVALKVAPVAPQPPPAAETEAPITYKRLRNGSWGIRSTVEIEVGEVVTVTKRSGVTEEVEVTRVLWSDGSVWLATIRG